MKSSRSSRTRRALTVTGIAVAGLVVLAFIAYRNAATILFWYIRPGHDFASERLGPPLDYATANAWVALPGKPSEASVVLKGSGVDQQATAAADVFFIHGTGYMNAREWNATLLPDDGSPEHAQEMIAWQASAFNACCRVFAPHYREATFFSFLDHGPNGQKAIETAYQDVARAFDYFVSHELHGRPFVLAGHSQGAVHALRLLEEKIDGTPLADQLVVAYLPGIPVPMEKLGQFHTVGVCHSAKDVGCVASWNVYRDPGDPELFRKTLWSWYRDRWVCTSGIEVLCTNPLSWKTDNAPVGASENIATIHPKRVGGLWRLLTGRASGARFDQTVEWTAHQTSAVCRDGFVRVPDQGVTYSAPLNGSYHSYEIALFFGNLRQNAIERVAAFRDRIR